MSTECKCYRLELRSKTARLLSRCVSVRAPSWIETINVGSYKQNLTPRDLISPGRGPHPGASCCCRPCSSTQGISAVSPPRSTGAVGGDCEHARPPLFRFFFFFKTVKGRLCNPAEPALESSGFMLVQSLPCILVQSKFLSPARSLWPPWLFRFFYPLFCL